MPLTMLFYLEKAHKKILEATGSGQLAAFARCVGVNRKTTDAWRAGALPTDPPRLSAIQYLERAISILQYLEEKGIDLYGYTPPAEPPAGPDKKKTWRRF